MTISIEAAISRLPQVKVEVVHKHNFKSGDYLLRISSTNTVTNYYVEDVISKSSFKTRQVFPDGRLSSTTETISGKPINDFHQNIVANLLAVKK